MYEHRKHPILSRTDFTKRVASHVMLAFLVLALALGSGVVGYHHLGELEWLDALLNEEAHIIVAAGQDDGFGSELNKHCQLASTDAIRHDRIGVVGTKLGNPTKPDEFFDYVRGHNLDSDRVIFVAPGIQATDAAA